MALSFLENNDTSTLLFALSSIIAGFIAYKCSTTPNPKPTHAEKNDILFNNSLVAISTNAAVHFWKYFFIAAGVLAAILSLDTNTTSALYSPELLIGGGVFGEKAATGGFARRVCPSYENLDERFVKPSFFSWICLATAITFGLLRIEAFRQLGSNFTFHLAKPSGLMTSGLYKYMQHPSYTGSLFFMTALFSLWMQPQGVMGCFVPVSWASGWVWWWWRVQSFVSLGWMTWGRVKQEEGMMKREFGKEWVEWHGKTARFIPGVF